jgi:archaellum component FlaF (FlaF/FlaG flagellin family)
MGNALVTLILVTVVMVSALGLVSGSVSALDMLAGSSKTMQDQFSERGRTSIVCTSVAPSDDSVIVRVLNNGSVPLHQFNAWDVIVEYRDASGVQHVTWLPYSSVSAGANDWSVEAIYFGGSAESVELGALNPGEDAAIRFQLDPAIGTETTNMVTVATNTGVCAELVFQRGTE